MAKQDESDLMLLHYTFGAFIRNQFGLWSDNVELLHDCQKVSGKTFMQPEESSSVIIKELWKRLRKTHKKRAV